MSTPNRPLVYSCSGCSNVAQLANALAVRLDREGLAEMSCIAGVGGRVPALVSKARSGRPILAITSSQASMQRPQVMQPICDPSRMSTPVGQTATQALQSMQSPTRSSLLGSAASATSEAIPGCASAPGSAASGLLTAGASRLMP